MFFNQVLTERNIRLKNAMVLWSRNEYSTVVRKNKTTPTHNMYESQRPNSSKRSQTQKSTDYISLSMPYLNEKFKNSN